jgi:hypothetical protein
MRTQKILLPLLLWLLGLAAGEAWAQTPTEQSKVGTPSPSPPTSAQSTPTPGATASKTSPAAAAPSTPQQAAQPPAALSPAVASLNPKELQGLDAFASGGQQLGKVTKVDTLPDGKVKDVELQSSGFLGMFKTTYVVPVDKVAKKGSRIELSMTTDQAKQFIK